MSAPLILFILTFALGFGLFFLRNRALLSSIVASLSLVLLSGFILLVVFDKPFSIFNLSVKISSSWNVLGRAFTLSEGSRPIIGFVYLTSAFILAAAWLTNLDQRFYPVIVACLGMVAASHMIDPFLFAAILLEFAAMGAALLLVSSRAYGERGGLRLLILYTFSMLAILLTGWLLEIAGVTTATPELAQRVTILLAFGFSILMALPPFHIWLASASEKVNSYTLAFIAILLQSAGLFFMLRFLDTYAWLRENDTLLAGIRVAGIATIVFGSLWCSAQKDIRKVMVYSLLADFGVILIAVGSGISDGYRLALGLSGGRVIGLAVMSLSLSVMFDKVGGGSEKDMTGLAYDSPIASSGFLIGLLSMAGFPLTVGFPGRWALLRVSAPLDPIAGSAIVLGTIILGSVTIRWGRILFMAKTTKSSGPESLGTRLILGGGVGLCLVLGLFPQISYPWVIQAATGLSQLIP